MENEVAFLIGGVPATCLAEQYATPLYVYEADAIRAAFLRIHRAVPYTARKVHYACVTNANLAIMQLVLSLDGGIHANTWGDALMALRAGFVPQDIVYSGSNLGKEDMLNLFAHGVAANLIPCRNSGIMERICATSNGAATPRIKRYKKLA
jgi:diaminopimelate decarboxylase